MDIAALMRLYYITRQQVLAGIVFGDNPGQQIALGGNDFTVFVGVFIEQRGVSLLYQAANFLVQTTTLFTLNVAIVTVFDVGAGKLFVRAGHQLVFNRSLDLVNIHLTACVHLAANDFCDGGTVICVIDSRCFSCT